MILATFLDPAVMSAARGRSRSTSSSPTSTSVFSSSGGSEITRRRRRGARSGGTRSSTTRSNGPYFWTGKGFGINLADADGFQVLADDSLRAPHSTNLEVLARAGVPGLVLWIVLQAGFAISLLRAAFRSYRTAPTWLPVFGWIFVYWLAALINGSFDVYLGGPAGRDLVLERHRARDRGDPPVRRGARTCSSSRSGRPRSRRPPSRSPEPGACPCLSAAGAPSRSRQSAVTADQRGCAGRASVRSWLRRPRFPSRSLRPPHARTARPLTGRAGSPRSRRPRQRLRVAPA